MKLSENALLTGHAASGMVKRGFIDRPATLAVVDRATEKFDVRKGKRDPEAASLSGGNLQKFVVGRRFCVSRAFSWPVSRLGASMPARRRPSARRLSGLAARGSAVLVISQDLDELIEIADRIAVMFHGSLSAPLITDGVTRETLGLLMGGASQDSELRVKSPDAERKHAVGA